MKISVFSQYFIKNAIIAKVRSRHAVKPHHLLSALLYAQPTGLKKNEKQT